MQLNACQMPDHSNQMSGKTSFGTITAADLTDGKTLFLVGPCDIFNSDNCQRQKWVIWPRLLTSSLLWHRWAKNGTCEQSTGTLEGKIQDRPISDNIWISDFSYLDIKYFKTMTFIQCLKIYLSHLTHQIFISQAVNLSYTLWSQWGFTACRKRLICFTLV